MKWKRLALLLASGKIVRIPAAERWQYPDSCGWGTRATDGERLTVEEVYPAMVPLLHILNKEIG